jgi:ketosteroid isomerase-like protein
MRSFLLILALMAAPTLAAAAEASPQQRSVEAVMADSAKGWNAGDVVRFMAAYSEAPETSFVTEEGLVRGKAAMIARYNAKYNFDDPAKRGVLSFQSVDFRLLDATHALYIGQWALTYPDGNSAKGYTSLVMALEKDGWRIVADHSS